MHFCSLPCILEANMIGSAKWNPLELPPPYKDNKPVNMPHPWEKQKEVVRPITYLFNSPVCPVQVGNDSGPSWTESGTDSSCSCFRFGIFPLLFSRRLLTYFMNSALSWYSLQRPWSSKPSTKHHTNPLYWRYRTWWAESNKYFNCLHKTFTN